MSQYLIFGNPIHHSKSPLMHNHALQSLDYPGVYGRYLLESGDMLKQCFLELGIRGANVTVPHKETAFAAADEVRGIGRNIGALNTLVLEDGRMIGYNTDAPGMKSAILQHFGEIGSVLILGAGGTAKAAVHQFLEDGLSVCVVNRSKGRLAEFQSLACETSDWEGFTPKAYDLILNTTSAGLEEEVLPMPESLLRECLESNPSAMDAIYGKKTPFLALAESLGCHYCDGETMLLEQGVLAFDLFTDHRFSLDKIRSAMKQGLALGAF